MSATMNPYQTPQAALEPAFGVDGAEAEAIRNEYLSHEASVRSIGILHFLSAAMFLLVIPFGLALASESVAAGLGVLVLAGGFAALFVWMGVGMRRLDPSVQIAVGITSALGLLNIGIGTLINAYILFLLFGAKGKVVFSEEYARVRAQTPHIQYQTPLLVKILGLLLLALIAFGLFAALGTP